MSKQYFDGPLIMAITVLDSDQLRAIYAVLGSPALVAQINGSTGNARGHTEAADEGDVVTEEAPDAAEVDSDGAPFDPALHTGTKLASGQWRMKKGIERPAAPAGAGADSATDASPSDAPAEDDEFAAFRAADAAGDAAAEPSEAVVRQWTDADLGALCNQAAVKLGTPDPVKAIIAEFTPEGAVPHSRNIPAERREDFAKAIEAKAEIEFAG